MDRWLNSSRATRTNATIDKRTNTSKRKATANEDQAPRKKPRQDSGTDHEASTSTSNSSSTSKQPGHKPNTTNSPNAHATTNNNNPALQILEETGNIFTAPPNTTLLHACNCHGSWGAGIALAFRNHYPNAYKIYSAHCRSKKPDQLIGTTLLIPPNPKDGGGHSIACLFTSRAYGKWKDSKSEILGATGDAVRDFLRQRGGGDGGNGEVGGEVWMCKINSGKFGVPWEQTREVLGGIELDDDGDGDEDRRGHVLTVKVIERE